MVGKTAPRAVEEAAVLNQDVGRAAHPRPEGLGFANFTSKAVVIVARTASSCTLANLVPRLHPTQREVREEAPTIFSYKKGRKDRRRKDRKKSRSSSKSSKGSRNSKGSKGSKGSGKGKRSSASTAAAVCLLGAMLAGATPQADAFTFQKEVSCQNSLCHSTINLALPASGFIS